MAARRCDTYGCTLPDMHAGLHCFAMPSGKRERRPVQPPPPPPPPQSAKAPARAEGQVLVRADNTTGFKGVYPNGGRFQARAREGGKGIHLGSFNTPEAAALAYARHSEPEAAAAAAAKAEAAEAELTAAQAKAQARAEGLVLVHADNATGFKFVYRNCGRFKAEANEGGKCIHLGYFGTPEAAALAYARHIAAAPPAAPQPEPTGADDDDQPADAEAAAPTAQPAGREILYDLNSDDSASEDDDDDASAAAVEAISTAEAGTSTAAEAASEANAPEAEADATVDGQSVASDGAHNSAAPGTSTAARKRPAPQAPAAAVSSSDASKQSRVATAPAREGL
eukprot:3382935-Prymnesium_polylepis.1